jgi:hypothetical protein
VRVVPISRRGRLAIPLALLLLCLAVLPSTAVAQPKLVKVGTFTNPIYVTGSPGDTSRLFVVERAGRIRVIRNGVVRGEPFLTIRGVRSDASNGLYSIAFPPNYSTSGLFYVFYTDQAGIKIAEYKRETRDKARSDSRRTVLSLPHTSAASSRHYGGQLQFDASGNLYISIGDGGPGGDPFRRAQDLGSLFGKLLRINPRRSGGAAYQIPAGNPYVGVAGARPEIWASGLRNPWRFSFDRATGDLVVGDLGEDRADEIDVASFASGAGGGANFGWSCYEGFQPYNDCSVSQHATPFMEKVAPPGTQGCRYSLTGGYVVRDPALSLNGRYVYGDFCGGEIRSVSLADAASDAPTGIPNLGSQSLVSFGEDSCGRLYVVDLRGPVYRVQDGSSSCP